MDKKLTSASNIQKLFNPSTDSILFDLLAELRSFAGLLKEVGIEVAIDSAASRVAWAGLETAKKYAVLKNFSNYHQNCRELHASGISLRDNRAFVNHNLKRANLFSKDDADKLFTNDQMVEIYDIDHIQISRSINFFDYCNYSLLDLLAREWMDLYERLPSVTKSLFEDVSGALGAKELRRFKTPPCIMKERDAIPCGVFETELLYCCPLYSAPGSLAGYLLVLNVTEIDTAIAGKQNVEFLRN